MQKLRATAQQNKVANEATLRNWIESRTVREIYEANLARMAIRRKFKTVTRPATFDDPRYPTRPLNAWAAFVKSRYNGPGVADDATNQARLLSLSREWKQLSAEERKVGRNLLLGCVTLRVREQANGR
jgi:hypothetical protein